VLAADVFKRGDLLSSRLAAMGLVHAWWPKPSREHGPLKAEPVPGRIMRW
jgi:hypothetical protein